MTQSCQRCDYSVRRRSWTRVISDDHDSIGVLLSERRIVEGGQGFAKSDPHVGGIAGLNIVSGIGSKLTGLPISTRTICLFSKPRAVCGRPLPLRRWHEIANRADDVHSTRARAVGVGVRGPPRVAVLRNAGRHVRRPPARLPLRVLIDRQVWK